MSCVRSPRILFVFLLLTTCLIAQNAPDQTPVEEKHRPRIALALSGGGARGLAHIGVLQWMEENHIPVDAIAGTSMGGIVGAMYASGSSPEDLRRIVHEIDWDNVTANEPPYADLAFRRKEDRRNDQVSAALGLKHGLSGPIGISPGQAVGLLLDRIAIKYPNLTDFDELPTPFRCVATDMLTGDAVVLKGGSLTQSLRATMAIPGIFTPVDMNGRVLADGGLVDNIPTDVARMMNADIVVAVNIGTPLVGRKELESLGGFLTQAVSVMTLASDTRALALADVKVAPVLGNYTILDFRYADEIMKQGYDGAATAGEALLKYKVSDEEWKRYLDEREARKRNQPFTPQVLEVKGTGPSEKKHLEKRLRGILGAPLNLDQLDTKLTRITGQGQYDSLGYEGFLQNGVPALRIIAHEKTYGPPFVDPTIQIGGAGASNLNFSAGARITFMDIAHHGGEWRNDLLLGSNNLAATEFYQPLGGTRFFVAPYLFASKISRNAFEGTTRIALLGDARQGGGFDIGYNTGRRSELRLGYEIFNGRLAPLIGDPNLAAISGSTGLVRARYVWDGQDNPRVPSRGTLVTASLSRVFQSPDLPDPIEQLEVRSSTFIPTTDKTSIFLAASGGTSFTGTAGPFQVFNLGGPFHLGAYLPDEFFGNHYGYAALGFRRQFYRLPQLVGKKIYYAGWYEAGTAFNSADSVGVHSVFNAGIIGETILGPISLFGSVSQTGRTRINFTVGRLF